MRRIATGFVAMIFIASICVVNVRAQEIEPNDYFATAQLLGDNTLTECTFSSINDVDIFMLEMSVDSIYHIYTNNVVEGTGNSLHAELFFEGDTTLNIFKGDPSSRGTGSNLRVAGWAPLEYGSGKYYLQLTHPSAIDGDGSYKVRIVANSMAFWAYYHEPDNTFAESFGQAPLPTDGVRYFGMLFDPNNPPTGKDDIDAYYMVGQQGQRLWVETEPFTGYPNIRDMDSKIYIWDADGSEELLGGDGQDDKSNQEESFDVFRNKVLVSGNNNVFSLGVIDSLPYDGLFYVIVTSYYSAYNGHQHNDSDPSTGGYYVYSWTGWDDGEHEPNNSAEEATPLCEPIPEDSRVSKFKNLVVDGKFDGDSDVDWYSIALKTTKMYEFCTTESSVGGDINLEVYAADDPSTNLIDDSVVGRYGSNDFRLSGWIPPKNGVYLFKLSPSAGSVGGENTGDYKLRMGWGVYRNASLWDEPNNSQSEAVTVEYDSARYVRALYPVDDTDWFKFEGTAGDEITVMTYSSLGDSIWSRDLDTKISLYDPSGTVKENDDYRVDGVTHPNNTYSGIVGYPLEATGTVYVKVEGYYQGGEVTPGNNGVGLYTLMVYSSAAAPGFLEKERNDVFARATNWPEDKEIIAKFYRSGSPNAEDVDIFKMNMTSDRMYFISSFDSDVGSEIMAEVYSENDTTTNLLDSNVAGRYNNNNFRISGFLPPENGIYYLKTSISAPGNGFYNLRRRSTLLSEVVGVHEPDNTVEQADALGTYLADGVTMKMALYNDADPEKENDVDIFRLDCVAGQSLVASTTPVGGADWGRDTDTKIHLTSADGTELISNDDVQSGYTYSTISYVIPEDGIYYLYVYGYYSAANGKAPEEVTDRDPGVGDYMLTVAGTMAEVEPNNSAEEANAVPVSNTNIIEASFSSSDKEDWFKVELEQARVYYFNTTESDVRSAIRVEVYSADNTSVNLIDEGVEGRYDSDNFRLAGWSPPADGTYLFKLYVPAAAIFGASGVYKFRAAGGELMSEIEAAHEPDNSAAEADGQDALPTDSTLVWAGFHNGDDFDIYKLEGVEGASLTCEVLPSNGDRWIRDVDTKITLYQDDLSTFVADNDDWDNWYDLVFYEVMLNEHCSNTYSKVSVDALPYTGTYYLDVYGYYGTHNDNTPSFSNPAVGSYRVYAVMKTATSVDELGAVPKVFALEENYPNPFNPTTTIEYALPKAVDVKITVYNIMGQKVATLIDQHQAPGYYKTIWNATNDYGARVSTGVYLYRIEAGDFVKTNKMLLVK